MELNKTHGLPPGTIKDADDLYPTIPSTHIATCTKDKTYFGKLPVDKQAYFIALGFVMIKSKQQQAQKSYSTIVNEPDVHYGEFSNIEFISNNVSVFYWGYNDHNVLSVAENWICPNLDNTFDPNPISMVVRLTLDNMDTMSMLPLVWFQPILPFQYGKFVIMYIQKGLLMLRKEIL